MMLHSIHNLSTIRFSLRVWLLLLACSAVGGDCSRATVLVNAFHRNSAGTIDTALEANDLNVEVDGKRARILSLSLDNRPRRIVLMVDTSGSMGASPQRRGWGIALPTAAYAVDVVPTSASAAFVTFSDTLHRESAAFENRNVVGANVFDLKSRQPQGRTLLFDSIHQVLGDFAELQLGDAIYLVTDGGENKSKTSLAQLKQELISRGIRVFVFLVLHDEYHTSEEMEGASKMQDLAEFTGGAVVRISSAEIVEENRKQLGKVAPYILAQVANFYHMELELPAAVKTARVKVSFADKNRKKNSSIAYSHQIAPCPPSFGNL